GRLFPVFGPALRRLKTVREYHSPPASRWSDCPCRNDYLAAAQRWMTLGISFAPTPMPGAVCWPSRTDSHTFAVIWTAITRRCCLRGRPDLARNGVGWWCLRVSPLKPDCSATRFRTLSASRQPEAEQHFRSLRFLFASHTTVRHQPPILLRLCSQPFTKS